MKVNDKMLPSNANNPLDNFNYSKKSMTTNYLFNTSVPQRLYIDNPNYPSPNGFIVWSSTNYKDSLKICVSDEYYNKMFMLKYDKTRLTWI